MRLRWYIGGLLFLSTVINYIDRQTLSVLAPYIKTEFQWSNTDFAMLIIAFRIAYAGGQTISGRLLDRFGTRTGLTASVAFYSVAAMLTSLATGFRSLAAFRFLLGLGESANWPGATKAVSEWFPRKESGWAVALFDSGSSIGGAIAPFLVLGVYHYFGSWRPAFIFTGLLGFGWLVLWRLTYHSPEQHPRISPEERAYILAGRDEGRLGGLGAAAVPHVAGASANLGHRRRQGADGPGVVFHHRLVRDLPRVARLPARREPAGVLGAVSGGRPGQLCRRGNLELPHRARLVGGLGAQDRRAGRRPRDDAAGADGVDRLATWCSSHALRSRRSATRPCRR